MAWWDDIGKVASSLPGALGGSTSGSGAPPPPSVTGNSGSSGITYQQYTAPAGPQGGSLPAGTVYTVGPNGSLSIDYRPSTSGGGSGSVSVSLNPNSTSAWSIREMPDGSLVRVNELTGQIEVISPAPTYGSGSDPRDLNSDGLDDKTGYALGVYPVSTSVSPTGFVYQGQPVWPDGSPYTGAGSQQGPNYEGTRQGPGGIYGYNPSTGRYEIIPGSEALGSGASSGPTTYSGGGGSSGASAYSSIATAQINAQSRLAAIEAEAQARAQAAQQDADLQKQLIRLQQDFQREQAAVANAFAAAGQFAQFEVANRQLEEQYNQRRVMLIGEYRDSLKDYDARAVSDAIRRSGTLEQALNQEGDFLTDNANAGAAALLGEINRPFTPLQPYDPYRFMNGGMSGGIGGTPSTGGGTPGGAPTGGGSGAPSGGMSGGLTTMPGAGMGVDLTQIERDLRAQGVPDAELAEVMREMQQGQAAVSEAQLSAIYQQLTGQGQYLTHDAMGNPTIAGYGTGGMHTLQQQSDPWFSGVWQTSDPYAPNYKSPNDPMFLPSWAKPTSASGMAGAGGNFVPPTEPIPTSHPLAGGLTGGVVKPPDTVIPMLAGGGMAKGAFITGDSLSGRPTGHEELVIAPGGAQVIPLGKMGAQQLMGRLPRFASGTPSYLQGMDWWSLSQAAQEQPVYEAPKVAVKQPTYTAPVPQPTSVIGATPTQALPTYTPPAPTQPTPTPVTGQTGGSGTTPSPTTTPLPTSPVSSPAPAQPPVTTTNPAQPATTTQPTTTTTQPTSPFSPASQELLDTVMAYRQGTADMGIEFSPWDVAWGTLTPFEQNLYYQNEAQKRGVPVELLAQDVARRRLPGFAGTLRQGY